MGNEASLEGGEGSLSELPEGLSADGKGGFIRTSTGEKVDLAQLSEAERNQLAAVMSRRPGEQPGSDAATSRQAFTKYSCVRALMRGAEIPEWYIMMCLVPGRVNLMFTPSIMLR